MAHISNGVDWIDELTFKTPSGKVYKMIKCDLDYDQCCSKCSIVNPNSDDNCGLDTNPEFKNLSCWGGGEDEGSLFYYYKEITDV
jgi:hypothetical protein